MFEYSDSRLKVLLGVGAAVGLQYLVCELMRRKRESRFERVGTVKELVCYPVKSCQGIYLDQAECTVYGLKAQGVCDR
mgnify:CR=1 FL=1